MAQLETVLGSEDEVDYPPNDYVYRVLDIIFVMFGAGTLITDWVFDIGAAYNHWCHNDIGWFVLTVVFMSSSSLVIMAVSLYWYFKDSHKPDLPKVSKGKWAVQLILVLLQVGPLLRYYNTLRYGLKSRYHWKRGDVHEQKQYYTWMLYEDSDSVFLRMFECFMESAPQLVLQLYILTQISDSEDPSKYGKIWWYTISVSSFTSLVSLAWGVMAYARGTRFTNLYKNNISLGGSAVIFLWHFFCLAARVTALVVFASCFRLAVVWVCVGHWVVMSAWLVFRRTFKDVCSSLFSEILLSLVLGTAYIFVFINERDEPTRKKYVGYYTLWEVENVAMLVLWLLSADPTTWYYIPAVVFHILAFFLGITFMVIYYCVLHPTRCPPPFLLPPHDQHTLRQPKEEVHEVPQLEL